MLDKINDLLEELNGFSATTLEEVEQFRIKHLSKKGSIVSLFADFKNVANEEKKAVGKALNDLKTAALSKVNELKDSFSGSEFEKSGLDLTLSADPVKLGSRHPLSLVRNEIIEIFGRLGFTISEGPEIEDD